ncbi:MAG: SDR family oxidoreductase [Proteobacteria bacterium]|nr:SDR family oxidoreductase [Pseudomonadota bacterium]
MTTPHTPKKLFCFGYGYVAQALAQSLLAQDPSWKIAGTTRDMDKLRALKATGVSMYLFDDDHPLDDPFTALEGVTHLLLSIPPNDGGDPAFTFHADDLLRVESLEWAGLLSSTGVYGDRDGLWVDETSELRPTNKRGSRRALAEAQWQSLLTSEAQSPAAKAAGRAPHTMPIHIFRLAGIYGPGRSALDAVRVGNSRRIDKPGHAFNRIHVEDIVQVLMASMEKPKPGRAYNVADDKPSPSHEVIAHACEILGMPIPPLIPFDTVDQAPMARSFYLDNKRVSNARIKHELGVALKYPDYTSGLEACLAAERSERMPMDFFRGGESSGG